MTHWCRDIPRDEAVRAAEDGRAGPLPTLEEAIAMGMITKTGSSSSAVEHKNKGDDMAKDDMRTERVTLRDAYRISIARRTEERDAAIRERDEFRRSFHWSEEAVTRLLAERNAALDAADAIRSRVAELEQARERFDTALNEARTRSGINDLILQRDEALKRLDAAIRERDKLRGEITSVLDRSQSASTELTQLRARVAELVRRGQTRTSRER